MQDARERREENTYLEARKAKQEPFGHRRRARAFVALPPTPVLRHVALAVVARRLDRKSAASREGQKFGELLDARRVRGDEQRPATCCGLSLPTPIADTYESI